MPINPLYPDVGLADYQTDTVGGLTELFAGDTPQPVSIAGTYTQASLGALAADLDINASNANLVGLSQFGLEYIAT